VSQPLREPSRGLLADRTGRALVAQLREQVYVWQEQLARFQFIQASGRYPERPIAPLLQDMEIARRKLLTELQVHGRDVRASAPVINLKRSLERAIEIARRLRAGSAASR
jgi:hypothetical protein